MATAMNLDSRESHKLIAADKVEGTKVKNALGETLGSIENVMIDKGTGRVAYAVMSFGGFLGIGERYHALPWSVLNYDTSEDAYVVNLDKDVLEKAPQYEPRENVEWDNRDWGKKVHDYYRVPPYWL